MACDHPIWVFGGIDSPGQERVPVPCGRCANCKRRRVNQWVFRLLQEQKVHDYCHFLTLTYDTGVVPISPNGFMTLDKGEYPRFMKRLRKLLPGVTLKYYYCGEYGTIRGRPHYHAIVFGCPDPELYHKAWSLDGSSFGDIVVGTVTEESISYVMKYIDKSSFRPKHGRDDRVPEFSGMSKGLGESYVTPAIKQYHKDDISRLYCTKPGGYRVSMPRYYRERIFSKRERLAQVPIIQDAVAKTIEAELLEFNRVYHDADLTFPEYLERQKLGRASNFNSKISDRDF